MDKRLSKPVLGVSARHTPQIGAFQKTSGVPRAYTDMIFRRGGIALMLPIVEPLQPGDVVDAFAEEMLDCIDGLIIIGGKDVNSRRFGQEPHPKSDEADDQRDEFDLALARCAYQRQMPMLGICRGLQVINVALGGTLNQHIDGHMMLTAESMPDSARNHRVLLSPGSKIATVLGDEEIETNSYHHQCVDVVGKGLRISGRAEDGTPEVIESEDRSYACVGVQWHPEIHSTTVSHLLVDWFLDQVREATARRCEISR